MADPAELQAMLKILSDGYAAKLPEKFAQIEQQWRQLPEDRWDEAGFRELHRLVHSLTGSGKTYGFPAVSEAARNLETCFAQIAESKAAPDEKQRKRVRNLLNELLHATTQKEASNHTS